MDEVSTNAGSKAAETATAAPRQGLGSLFRRFLRFGLLGWGGPTAQIAMIREELVDREKWIDSARFNRVLAVYQALPGPEAHELCVYFGMVARGRIGAVLAGLGFMLPGFVLMMLASWLYVATGLKQWWLAAAFAGCQPAVVALIFRGVMRIGRHALEGPSRVWLCLAAVGGAVGQFLAVPFWMALAGGGVLLAVNPRRRPAVALCIIALWGTGAAWWVNGADLAAIQRSSERQTRSVERGGCVDPMMEQPTRGRLLGVGLKAGLLTFGGAYTAIPFVEADAVTNFDHPVPHGWMRREQFLDGLAIGAALPAPLIIFGTFVGFLGGGWAGAVLMTIGIFAPAFSFTLLGHRVLERVVDEPRVHDLLYGITAAVVGIMFATAAMIGLNTLRSPVTFGVAVLAYLVLRRWKRRFATPGVLLGAAAFGVVISAFARFL